MALETGGSQDGQGTGAASTGTPATGTPSTATSPHQPSTSAVGSTSGATPAAGAAGAGNGAASSAAGTGTPAAEDRSTWIPPHRMRQSSRELAEARRALDQARSQLAAVTGIQPPKVAPSARLPEGVTEEMLQRARDEFGIVMPHLSKLTAEQVDKLVNFLENGGITQSEETTNRMWARHGSDTVRQIHATVKAEIGELSQKGMDKILRAFHSNLQTDQDFYERYQAGDSTLVAEFVNEYKADLLDPYHTSRAGAAASTITRARTLPRAGASSSVVPAGRGAADAELDPADEDAVHKRAFQRMRAAGAATR